MKCREEVHNGGSESFSQFFFPLMSKELYHTIFSLIDSLHQKDPDTVYHSSRVAYYAMMIACEMNCSMEQCFTFYLGGMLHDIGKLHIQEAILHKPSQLSVEEYHIIKQHPQIGYEILNQNPIFKNQILDMALYHHERFDGTGYPMNLKGDQIPLAARILSIADSFDAMTTRRIYRKEKDFEHALNQIYNNRGLQFDPEISNIFLKLVSEESKKPRDLQFQVLECMKNGRMECCS